MAMFTADEFIHTYISHPPTAPLIVEVALIGGSHHHTVDHLGNLHGNEFGVLDLEFRVIAESRLHPRLPLPRLLPRKTLRP